METHSVPRIVSPEEDFRHIILSHGQEVLGNLATLSNRPTPESGELMAKVQGVRGLLTQWSTK
jgi:hypothetical protein